MTFPEYTILIWGSIVLITLIITLFLYILLPIIIERTHWGNFDEVFEVFTSIIKSEMQLYESDVFENSRPINNANFENYYNDLSMRIIKRISPTLMRGLKRYLTEEAIISYIARTVKQYLSQYTSQL